MSGDVRVVYLGLGSNLGERQRTLAEALRRLAPQVRIEAVSALYETDPVGPQDQPPFYNAACRGTTELPPRALLRHVQAVERDLGRRRAGPGWGPRLIDIDILLLGDDVIDEPDLKVPHPELHRRAFVLVPLAELAGELRHPASGLAINALLDATGRSGVRLCAEQGWENR